MDQRERRADARQERAGFPPGQRGALAQVAPVEELHRVVRSGLVDAIVVNFDDPRVRQLRERMKFALEEGDQLFAARWLLGQRQLL
jgi:hypothetical protein